MANTGLLNRVAREVVEPQVQPWTALIGGWLPQHWVFTTESGSSTFVVQQDGLAAGVLNASPTPDVTVEWTDTCLDAALTVALTNGDRSSIPQSPRPRVTAHTPKGKDALSFLGDRFGLK